MAGCTRSVLIVALAACGDSSIDEVIANGKRYEPNRVKPGPARPKPAPRPLEVTWSDTRHPKGQIVGGGSIEATGYRGNYHITLRDLAHGSTWKVGAEHGVVDAQYELIDVPIDDRLANLTWKELEQADPKLELELSLVDGRTGKLPLKPIDVSYMVEESLREAQHHPVRFGTEPDDPKQQDSLVWPRSSAHKHIGKSGKLYETDWVLITNKTVGDKGKRRCGGYTTKGVPAPDITLILKETEAVIYDRRTGDVVDRKTFQPDASCPKFVMMGGPTHESYEPDVAIASWAASKIRR